MISLCIPEEKTNHLAAQYTSELLAKHPLAGSPLTGENLKTFAPHPQINKFLLFQVFQALQAQEARLKHPYFDFEDETVRDLVGKLFAHLSLHIRVGSADLRALTQQAAFNNILLAAQPVPTLTHFFFGSETTLTAQKIERLVPFFEDFGFLVRSILAFCRKQPNETLTRETFEKTAAKVLHLYAEKTQAPVQAYQEQILQHLTGYTFAALENEIKAEAEEAARLAAIRQAEEETRLRAEAARKEAEAAAKAAEEAALRAQAETPVNFFETMSVPAAPVLELDLEEAYAAETPDAENDDLRPGLDATPSTEPRLFSAHEEVAAGASPREITATHYSPEVGAHTTPEVLPQELAPTVLPDEEMRAILEMADAVSETATTDSDTPSPDEEAAAGDGLPRTVWSQLHVERTKTILEQINQGPVSPPSQDPPQPPTVLNRFAKETPTDKGSEEAVFVPKFPVKPAETPGAPKEPLVKKEAPAEEVKPFSLPGQEPKDRPKTIAERLLEQNQSSRTVAPVAGAKAVRPEDIPLHKQYQFSQKVFEGNNVRFRVIFDKVNSAADRAEVQQIIERYILSNEKLNVGDPVVEEFLNMLLSRFPE